MAPVKVVPGHTASFAILFVLDVPELYLPLYGDRLGFKEHRTVELLGYGDYNRRNGKN